MDLDGVGLVGSDGKGRMGIGRDGITDDSVVNPNVNAACFAIATEVAADLTSLGVGISTSPSSDLFSLGMMVIVN